MWAPRTHVPGKRQLAPCVSQLDIDVGTGEDVYAPRAEGMDQPQQQLLHAIPCTLKRLGVLHPVETRKAFHCGLKPGRMTFSVYPEKT